MFWMPYSKRPVITRIPADRSAEIATLRAKLAEAERQRDEAVKLLREWLNGHCSGIIRRDLTERTEAYIAGVPHE